MNYFELFGIPVSLKVNKTSLSAKFFDLSKKFHPDYVTRESAAVQDDALENSAMLNQAWKIFGNPDSTIKYVLQQKGLLEEEEKYQLPPEFLMEVMEINEAIMDAQDNPELKESVLHKTKDLENEIYEPVREVVENYREDITTEKELLQVKEYYFKKKYLQRIREQLKGKM